MEYKKRMWEWQRLNEYAERRWEWCQETQGQERVEMEYRGTQWEMCRTIKFLLWWRWIIEGQVGNVGICSICWGVESFTGIGWE